MFRVGCPVNCWGRANNVHVVFEMSRCFLQPFFQIEILAGAQRSIGLQARDADGWFFMVGQKVIWEVITVRGLGRSCTDSGALLPVTQEVLETRRLV